MKSAEEIKEKIQTLNDEIEVHLDEQRQSNFTGAVSTIQEIINSKMHRIDMLEWVVGNY